VDESKLATKTYDLVDVFADRVPETALRGLRSMAGGGEWDELLDLLLAVLVQTRVAVTAPERDHLREVLAGWSLWTAPVEWLARAT
jgi:hypothetical protein